jgi:EmrB/QacA subfamily drug resistance transporter
MTEPAPRAWAALAISAMAVFLVFLDTTVLYVAYPDLRASFPDVSPAALSWVLNSYTIAVAALLIPAGRLADRLGRKRVFLTSVALFCAGSALCGLAPDPTWLVGSRVLQAIGAAGLIPSSLALVLKSFPREKVPVAVAVWGAVGALAGAIGPTVSAVLVDAFSWRAVFYINVPVSIGVLLLGRGILTESKETDPGKIPDPAGVLLVAGGIALVALGVVQSDNWGWVDTRTVASIAGGAAVIGAFVLRSRRVAEPLVDLDMFRINGFRWGNLGMVAFAIAFSAMFFGNIQWLTNVWGWSVLKAGAAISPGPAIVAIVAPFAGRAAARYGQRRILIPGGLIYASGALWLVTHVGLEPNYLGDFLPGTLLGALGVALCLPQLSSAAVQSLPPDRFAAGSAVGQAIRQLGTTLGVALVIAFIGTPSRTEVLDRFHRVWFLIIAGGVLVTLAALPLRRAPAARPVLAGPAVAPAPVPAAAH